MDWKETNMRRVWILWDDAKVDENDVVLRVTKEMDVMKCFMIANRMMADEIIVRMEKNADE